MPYREGHYNLMWDGRVDKEEEYARMLLQTGEARQAGAYYYIKPTGADEELRFHGSEEYTEYIREHYVK